ncbi:MAG: WG repeat-containing protein [Chloracidobacterium sp.]|nr:WG repeat-containing protein [Chloracidobacterium sp.]
MQQGNYGSKIMIASFRISTAMVALLLAASCARSSDPAQYRPVDCRHFPNLNPVVCKLTSDGAIVVSRQSLADISFGPEGLGSIIVDNRDLYFVTRQGKTAPALIFDNGPDYVVEGLARTVKNGKIGFINAELHQVVAPIWDFAFPFEHGVAVVCMGCASKPAPPNDDHEHQTMTGGKWGYIDKHGRIVVPVVYDPRSLPPVEVAEKLAIQLGRN